MSTSDKVDLQTISAQIQELNDNITKPSKHPFVWIALLVAFFISMDFWVKAVDALLEKLYPYEFTYIEYGILSITSLILIVYLSYKSGFDYQIPNDPTDIL